MSAEMNSAVCGSWPAAPRRHRRPVRPIAGVLDDAVILDMLQPTVKPKQIVTSKIQDDWVFEKAPKEIYVKAETRG
jgi:hypothetical protein